MGKELPYYSISIYIWYFLSQSCKNYVGNETKSCLRTQSYFECCKRSIYKLTVKKHL